MCTFFTEIFFIGFCGVAVDTTKHIEAVFYVIRGYYNIVWPDPDFKLAG